MEEIKRQEFEIMEDLSYPLSYEDTETSKSKKPKKIHPCMLKTFKRNRNYQAEQQAILLLLLNQYFDITIKKPQKTKCECQQFFKIIHMTNGEDEVEVNTLIEKRCDEIAQKDIENGINAKTATRRKIVNRHVETLHLLNDMLSMKGCIFNCKMTTGNHGVVKDTIVSLKFGDWTLTKDQISLFGKQINEFLSDLIKQEKGTVTLKRDQNVLVNYFNKIISQSE